MSLTVKSMEGYLRPIEDEMEWVVQQRPSDFDAASLVKLSGFRAKAADSDSTFMQFRTLYHEARNGLVLLVASRRSGTPTVPSSAQRTDEL